MAVERFDIENANLCAVLYVLLLRLLLPLFVYVMQMQLQETRILLFLLI